MRGPASDIHGQNVANPVVMIWSAALMLDFIDQSGTAGRAAHDAIVAAIESLRWPNFSFRLEAVVRRCSLNWRCRPKAAVL